MSFQRLILVGHVGRDPESFATSGGTELAKFSLAVSEKRGGDEHTEWFNCVAFGKTSAVVMDYVGKGSLVGVEGRLRTRKYEKDGQARYATDVMVDNLRLLGRKADASDRQSEPRAQTKPRGTSPAVDSAPSQSRREREPGDDFDDDIPF